MRHVSSHTSVASPPPGRRTTRPADGIFKAVPTSPLRIGFRRARLAGRFHGAPAAFSLRPRNPFASHAPGLYVNLGSEGAVYGAFVGYLQQLGALLVAQRAMQFDITFDAVQLAFLRFT